MLSMENSSVVCSLLALLSYHFGVLFFSLPVTRPLRRDIVKKECALRMAHDLCPRPLRPPADIAVGRTASVFQAFQRPVMPLSPLVYRLATDLVLYRRRCAFSPSAFMYVGVGGLPALSCP